MTVVFKGRVVVDLEVEGVDPSDYPDFCDAYFSYGVYEGSGEPLSDDDLIKLSDEYGDVVNEMAFEHYM
jgi:hypothetical protein